jgi:RHS repeat-associated protein
VPTALTLATDDHANQIATFGGTTFSYDDNGNLTNDGTRSYTWNARNQLASLTGPVNGSFAYDGVGRRRSKTIGSRTTQFLFDGLNPVQELSSGTPTANLLTGLAIDEFFTRTDSAGVRNYLTDVLGSSLALADGSGTIQTEYTYSPFGETTTSGASTTNSFAFTGRESDATGLHYYRARYLHPSAHRFISEDPLGVLAGDPNVHAYVFNRPTGLTDPTGELAWLALPAAGCVGGALGMGMTQGWGGRKLALGCALGAGIGLGFAAAPALGSAAAAAAGAAGAAAARFGSAAGAAARATAAAAARAGAATAQATRAAATSARAAASSAATSAARAAEAARNRGAQAAQSIAEAAQRAREYASSHPADVTEFIQDFFDGAGLVRQFQGG